MKHPNGLNHHYFIGQVFNLDQKTMNEMIEDIHKLLGDRGKHYYYTCSLWNTK